MPMDFTSAGARVRSLIAGRKPTEGSRSALPRDVLRDNVIDEEIAQSPRFQALERQTPEVKFPGADGTEQHFQWDTFPEAVRDIARAAFGYDEPTVLPREQVRKSHQFNRDIVAQTIEQPEFVESRPWTRSNAPESVFGAQTLAQAIIAKAPELAEHIARAEQMARDEDRIDEAQDMIDDLRDRARRQHDAGEQIDPQTAQDMKQLIADREAAKQSLQATADAHAQSDASSQARKVARAAAGAYKDAIGTVQALRQLPGCEPGAATNVSGERQIELAEKLAGMPDLRKIADIIGRVRPDVSAKRRVRSRDVRVEPVGITTGRDITRLLPTEIARMQVPALRPLWLLDWSSRSLLEWQMSGKEPLTKGAMIPVIDGSASMLGQKFTWASAIGGALLAIAHQENRDFAGVEFGSKGQVKSWMFPAHEPPDPENVIDYLTHFFNGGTDNHTGLQEAKRIIDTLPRFDTADIVLISDGHDLYEEEDQELVRELTASGVRIHGISILTPDNAYLKQACEYVVDVTDLIGVNSATDALAENLS